MKKNFTPFLWFTIIIIFCVFVAACTKEVNSTHSTAGSVSAEKAATFTDNEKLPVDYFVIVPCANDGNGEYVHLTGFIHLHIHTTTNGNHFTVKYDLQPQGVKGVGMVTGTIYQANGITQEKITGLYGDNNEYESTDINNFRIIGKGVSNNFLVHTATHLTINANGTITATTDQFSAECK